MDLETLGESVGVDDKDEDAVEEVLAVWDGEEVLEGDSKDEGVDVNVGGWMVPVGLLPPLELSVPFPAPNDDVPDPVLIPSPYGLPDTHMVALAFPRDTDRWEDWLGGADAVAGRLALAEEDGQALTLPVLNRPSEADIDTDSVGVSLPPSPRALLPPSVKEELGESVCVLVPLPLEVLASTVRVGDKVTVFEEVGDRVEDLDRVAVEEEVCVGVADTATTTAKFVRAEGSVSTGATATTNAPTVAASMLRPSP